MSIDARRVRTGIDPEVEAAVVEIISGKGSTGAMLDACGDVLSVGFAILAALLGEAAADDLMRGILDDLAKGRVH